MKAASDLTDIRDDKAVSVDSRHIEDVDTAVARRAWLKVDFRVMPIAIILYLASYIDRANIGNAAVLGLEKDLGLSSSEYNWALSIFFIGYVVYETPSNLVLKRVRPSIYVPIMVVLWGLTCSLIAKVRNASGLLAIRFFLGVAESGFLPAIVYLLGSWYPRPMQGKRFGILYSTVSLTGAFGGLLATAIHSLDGRYGIVGWEWIFIVEGVVTIGLGFLAFIFVPDYADTAKWLNDAERKVILEANEADRALKPNEKLDWSQVRASLRDYRTYLWGLVYLGNYVPVYSAVLSLPSVVQSLGPQYTGTRATLLATPPYAVAFFVVLVTGYTSDKLQDRYWHLIGGSIGSLVALVVLMTVKSSSVRYGMFFILCSSMFVPVSMLWSWLAMNSGGSTKRAVTTGIAFSIGNIGGAISGQIYRSQWAPYYVKGHAINVGAYALSIISATALWLSFRRDNARRDKEAREKGRGRENMIGVDLGGLGDLHPDFRYYV